MSDMQERVVQKWVDVGYRKGTADMEAFVERFHALCAERHIDGEHLQKLTQDPEVGLLRQLKRYTHSLGRVAQNAYTPTGGRDVRHMNTGRAAKGNRVHRARVSQDAHATHMDAYRRKLAYVAVLERQFCTSKNRKYKRAVRQICRFMCRDFGMRLPVVFAGVGDVGAMWYDESLCK